MSFASRGSYETRKAGEATVLFLVEYCIPNTNNRYHTHPKHLPHPSREVSIRGMKEQELYSVVDVTNVGQAGGAPKLLEEIEFWRALFETFEGAVVSRYTGAALLTV